MIGKLLCSLGFHNWIITNKRVQIRDHRTMTTQTKINEKCSRCGNEKGYWI